MHDPILERAALLLRPVPDFPKPGILFFDLSPLLRDVEAMRHIMSTIAEHWRPFAINAIAAFDARGFLFGSPVAERLGVPLIMIRKKGKLPPPTEAVSYGLEYGTDVIETSDDGFINRKRILLIDDLLATGGTAAAGVELINRLGGTAVGFACVSEIPALGGRGKLLDIPVHSLITIMDGRAIVGVEYCVDVYTQCRLTNSLLLIERLGEVPGIAMPGGRIEAHESVLAAATRELTEETGCHSLDFEFIGMLTGLQRDPRGPKVSVVIKTRARFGPIHGEPGKTRPFWVNTPNELPAADRFVFLHDTVVYERFPTQFTN